MWKPLPRFCALLAAERAAQTPFYGITRAINRAPTSVGSRVVVVVLLPWMELKRRQPMRIFQENVSVLVLDLLHLVKLVVNLCGAKSLML